MKNLFNTALCLLLLLPAWSCVLDEIDTQMTDEEAIAAIRLECDALEAYTIQATKPQAVSFRVNSTTPWTVSVSDGADWLSVEPASSSVSSLSEDVRITAKANSDLKDRTAVVTVKGENTSITHTVQITQMRKGQLTVVPVAGEFSADGGQQSFSVESNLSWDVTAADDWLTFSANHGDTDGTMKKVTVQAIAAANKSVVRSTTMTVVSGDDKREFLVNQNGQFLEFLPVDEPSIDRLGGELELSVKASMDWKVEVSDPAFTATKVGNDKIKLSAHFNNQFAARLAAVTIKPVSSEYGDVNSSVEVSQDINFEFSGHVEILSDGSAKVFADGDGDKASRITTRDAYRYVSCVVTLGEKKIEKSAQMFLCTHDAGAGAEYQCQIDLAGNKRLRSNGSGTSYKTTKFTITQEELQAIETYRMDFVPDAGTVKLEFFYNGTSMASQNSVSVFESDPEAVGHYFFGLEKVVTDGTWYVVKTFDVTPIAE